MKRILTGLLAIGMAAATWAVNDDNPCKHPNLGNCTIELENSLKLLWSKKGMTRRMKAGSANMNRSTLLRSSNPESV